MNRSLETVVRLINLTSSGLLAGSLGFGNSALIPGWEEELPRYGRRHYDPVRHTNYLNAIGPTALATSLTLALGARHSAPARRLLDVVSALSLVGVLGTTMWGTVPINKKLDLSHPLDYPSQNSQSLAKTWARAHTVRTALGLTAFICAAAANVVGDRHRK